MNDARFKISLYPYSVHFPFGLFVREKRRFFRDRWRHIEHFETKEKCLDPYEQIKDLPEYLP